MKHSEDDTQADVWSGMKVERVATTTKLPILNQKPNLLAEN